MTRLAHFVVGLCLAGVCAPAGASTVFPAETPGPVAAAAAADGWSNLEVPGGVVPLLRIADLDPGLPRTRALREIIRVVYDAPEGLGVAPDLRRGRVLDYLRAVSAMSRLTAAFPQGVSLRRNGQSVPRDVAEGLAAALGCRLDRRDERFQVEADDDHARAARREALTAAGLDVAAAIATLNDGGTVSLSLAAESVPLPVPPALWQNTLVATPDLSGSLATAILGSREASLLYYGLLGMDAPTRDFLAARPGLMSELLLPARAALVAGFGSGLTIVDGRISVPGGAAEVTAWEELADERVSQPERFILALFEKDQGRLAMLYHTVAFLDAPRRLFVLGPEAQSPDQRKDRLKRLYRALAVTLPGWNALARLFWRARVDVARLVLMTRVGADGRLGALAPRKFWRRAFDGTSIPESPAKDLRDLAEDGDVDVADLVSFVGDPGQPPDRMEAWALAHRVFHAAAPAALPDVLVTVRAFSRFRTLGLTLERMGVHDASVYAAAIRRAAALDTLIVTSRADLAHVLFQSGLALVERARFGRTFAPATATALVRSLSASAFDPTDGTFRGVRAWVTSELLPAVRAHATTHPDPDVPALLDASVLAAMAGRAMTRADSANLHVSFEGLEYRVDPAAADLRRFQAIRRRQEGVTLDGVMAFSGAVDALAERGVTVQRLPALASDIERSFRAMVASGQAARSQWLDPQDAAKDVARAVDDLKNVRQPKDLSSVARRAAPLLDVADAYLARHGEDQGVVALALRLIYDAHAAGRVVVSPAVDGERAARLAEQYRANGGLETALIDRWVTFIKQGIKD